MTAFPNLFIIGSMKSGTTYLHELLAGHPDILMSTPKEPCYFVDPAALARGWPQMARAGWSGNRDAYLGLFDAGADRCYRGESSTLYTFAPILTGVPERVHAMAPDARLIYLMRDPVARSIAHYWHDTRVTGAWQEVRTAMTPDSPYVVVSDYARQLRPWLATFGRDRLLALSFESLIAEPAASLTLILDWLGVAADYAPDDLRVPRNVAEDVTGVGGRYAALAYRLRHSAVGEQLAALLPWRLRQRLGRGRRVARTALDLRPVQDHLRGIQRAQVQALAELLDREFPEWTVLHQDD